MRPTLGSEMVVKTVLGVLTFSRAPPNSNKAKYSTALRLVVSCSFKARPDVLPLETHCCQGRGKLALESLSRGPARAQPKQTAVF